MHVQRCEVCESLDNILSEVNLANKAIKYSVFDQICIELYKFWEFREINVKMTIVIGFGTLGWKRILNLIVNICDKEIEGVSK